MIRILVADDHSMVRRSILALLGEDDDIRVVGEASNGKEAVELAKELDPDLVIMDISMPRMDGITATENLQSLYDELKIIILSMHANQGLVELARRKGASGYLLKKSVANELLPAIYQVYEGGEYLSDSLAPSNS